MIKLFATDLDGTLLKNYLYVEKQNQEAIHFLHNKGTEIAFATGRTDQDIVQLFEQLKINGHRLSQNGAIVVDKNKQSILESKFTPELSKKIYDIIKNYPVYFFVTTKDHIYFNQEIPILDQLQEIFNHRLSYNDQLSQQVNAKLPVSKFMLLAEPEVLQVIQAELDAQFNDEINHFLSAPKCVDIVPPGVNKATGMTHLIDSLQIQSDEIAVIGDSQNDIDMLKMTPHSYAMSSADHDVKQAATHVVDHVFQAIDHLRENRLL